jgi:pyruvate dehydrogenase E2 component (dihydrolipoamide acetyltransferase)
LKRLYKVHSSVTDLLIKAAALALTKHQEINVSFAGEAIRRHGSIDIGIAVGLEDGLITPVLRNCGAKTLDQISSEAKELIDRARNKRLQPHEYEGATFSISNLGMFEVENFIAVLVPPQAATLAVGAIRDVPVVDNGAVKVGRRMKVTLSCDHRALDGLQAAKFLQHVKAVLEAPLQLVVGDGPR